MERLAKVLLRFQVPPNLHINQNLGSIMQGVLMEQLDPLYTKYLHEENLRPYSQFIMYDNETKEMLWNISALNTDALENILMPLQNLPKNIYLKKKHAEINLTTFEILAETSYESLLNNHLTNNTNFQKINFNFITTTTFKSDGVYQIYPNVYYIFHNLYKRWQEFAPLDFQLDSHLDLAHICQNLMTTNFNLKYKTFSLEQTTIPGFCGKYQLKNTATSLHKNLIFLLADYANYAGVGIKTAIGMGGTLVYSTAK